MLLEPQSLTSPRLVIFLTEVLSISFENFTKKEQT